MIPDFRLRKLLVIGLILLASLVLAVFLIKEARTTGGVTGVPLDDSWIHFQFARNLRNGHGFSFNPGAPTPGSTSLLWDLVLAVIGLGYVVPAKAIGMAAFVGAGVLAYLIGLQLRLSLPFAFAGGLLSLLIGRFAWLGPSGMETTLFAFVSLLAIYAWFRVHSSSIPVRVSALFALAIALRPEGLLLAGLSYLDWLFHPLRDENLRNRRWGALLRHVFVSSFVIVPILLFNFNLTGNLLPNTFYARSKTWGCQFGWGYMRWIATTFFLDNPVAVGLSLVGLPLAALSRDWRSRRGPHLLLLWAVTLPLAYGVIAPCTTVYYLRYTAPVGPIYSVIAAAAAWKISSASRARWDARRSRVVNVAIAGILVLAIGVGAFLTLGPWATHYARSVSEINSMHIVIGRWLKNNTPSESVIALNDVGAITYHSDREIVDLVGLVSPEVLPYVMGRSPGTWDEGLSRFLAPRKPDYLVVFPSWYPQLVQELELTPLFRVSLENPVIVSGEQMVVYRLDWD